MKNLILLVILILMSSQNCFALNSSHTEMEYKKKKALSWYKTHGNKPNSDIAFLKDRAVRWYTKNVIAFRNEIKSSKQKTYRWYGRNNK